MKQYSFATLLLAVSLGLNGCFYSNTDLISAENRVSTLAPGEYRALALDEDGTFYDPEEIWQGEITYRDGRLHSDTEEMPLANAVFMQINDHVYAGHGSTSDDDEFMYVLLHAYSDGSYYVHLPMCDRLSATARVELGFAEDSDSQCELTDTEHLRAVFRTYVEEMGGQLGEGVRIFPVE